MAVLQLQQQLPRISNLSTLHTERKTTWLFLYREVARQRVCVDCRRRNLKFEKMEVVSEFIRVPLIDEKKGVVTHSRFTLQLLMTSLDSKQCVKK